MHPPCARMPTILTLPLTSASSPWQRHGNETHGNFKEPGSLTETRHTGTTSHAPEICRAGCAPAQALALPPAYREEK